MRFPTGGFVRTAMAVAVLTAVAVIDLAAQYPTQPPPPAPLSPLRFPDFQEARLGNGLEILVVEDHDLPIVSISLSIPTGSVNEPSDQRGLASMVAELMTKGTETRSAEEIAAAIEGAGGSLIAGAGTDFFTLSSTVLTDQVDLAFTLMSDVLLNATYPESELELARTRFLSGLRLEKSDPGAIADRYFARALYGAHPYGLSETEETIQAITRASVEHFAQEQLRPGGSLLVIAGDLSLAQARELVDRHLGSWSGEVPQRSYGSPPASRATEIILVHRPGSEQSNIVYGNMGMRPGDDTYYHAIVGNKVLGGGSDARLYDVLRQQKGWTYGSYSNVNRPYDVGRFQATAEVRTEVTDSALAEMLYQFRRIRTENIPDEEMTSAKGYLVGVFPLTIETPQQIAGQVSTQKRLGLGDDYLERYRERLAAVTADQARQAMSALLQPDSAVILVVGDGQTLYDKLAAIAPVRIIDVEGNALTPDDLTPTATEVAFDFAQLVPRRDSLQIVVQGNVFGGMVTEIQTEGDEVVYQSRTALPAMGLNQQAEVRMTAGSLALRSTDQVMQFGPQAGETHLVVEGGRITGHAQTPQPGGVLTETDIDTTFTEGMFISAQVQALIPMLPLAEGASFTLSVLDSEDASIKPYNITVEGVEEVTVPAGTFSVFRVGMTGGDTPTTFYVSRDTPRKIVKWQLLGQPVAFELVN